MRIATATIVLALLGGCQQAAQAPAQPAAPATATVPDAAPAPVPATTDTNALDPLARLLTCGDAAAFEGDAAARVAAVAKASGLACAPSEDGSSSLCAGDGKARLFGLPVRELEVWTNEEVGFMARFDAAPQALRDAIARGLGREPREDPEVAGAWDLERTGSPMVLRVVESEMGAGSLLACSRRPADAGIADAGGVPAGWARLAGNVTYPSEELPAMRVCAVDAGDIGRGYCTTLPRQSTDWALAVPPGNWLLWAWPLATGADERPGRHSQASSCLAETGEGCNAHAMRPIEVAAGEARTGLMINDWYADPGDGEDLPRPPRGEPVPGR